MVDKKHYLRENVVVEPLFNQWYAWSYLISPATAAMYTVKSHIKIMQSFISTPQVHVSALKNLKMMGGPFINHPVDRVNEIKELLEKTIQEQSHLFELAEAIKTLEEFLSNEAKGYSLEPIYKKVPEALKGYVELVYDLNNQPSIRFIEALLYKSKYYNPSTQSIVLHLTDRDNERPFVFSTPVLNGEKNLHLKIPFHSKRLDKLFKMKDTPQSLDYISEVLEIKKSDKEIFASLFTRASPCKTSKYTDDLIRVRYFGHACILIESKGASILCDPVISYKYNHTNNQVPRYTYADLPERIDYVLITHNHQDHCMFETLLQLRHKIDRVIVPKNGGAGLADLSLKLVLQNIGFQLVQEIDEMETIFTEDASITGLPFFGEHADLNIRTKTAYLVKFKSQSILIAADSNNIETKLYQHIYDLFGEIKLMFLGMECDGGPLSWLYGPLLTKPLSRKMDQSRRFDGSDCQKAMHLVNLFNPQAVYIYAMGQEPWLTYLTSIQYTAESRPIIESNKLVENCKSRGIEAELLFGKKEIFLN